MAHWHFQQNYFKIMKSVKKLRNACCWLFDSYCGENELLSFVQATITLEILLGDKSESDKVGLGSLLKNRCAYLLGKTSKERNIILRVSLKKYMIFDQRLFTEDILN